MVGMQNERIVKSKWCNESYKSGTTMTYWISILGKLTRYQQYSDLENQKAKLNPLCRFSTSIDGYKRKQTGLRK